MNKERYDMCKKFIEECRWDILEAQRQLGVNHSSISRCCNNKQKVAGGFHWKYVSHS